MANMGSYIVSDEENNAWKAAMRKVKLEDNYMSATHLIKTLIRCMSDEKGYQRLIDTLRDYK